MGDTETRGHGEGRGEKIVGWVDVRKPNSLNNHQQIHLCMSQSKLIDLPNAEATYNLGINFGRSLVAGTTILLQGDLGSGKTSLVQGIAVGLGILEPIVSPTFNLINEYNSGRLPLYHLDLYRLEPPEVGDLYLENYWEGIEVDLGIVAIEWAERLPYKPQSYLSIELVYSDRGGRVAKIIPIS
jgi:tRNA threonylcarbamoyladenosine biosynthesis protein TsaE